MVFFLLVFANKRSPIVCVSPTWSRFLKHLWFKNIVLIENPINTSLLPLLKNTTSLITNRQDKVNISRIARSNKGWPEICTSLRSFFPDAHIWLSSPVKSPRFTFMESKLVKMNNLHIKYFPTEQDLFTQFQDVDIAVFNSQFMEGWNRTLVQMSIVSNAVIFAKSIGGMIDVAKYCSWITVYDNHSHLQSYLYWNCHTRDEILTCKESVLNQKKSNLNSALHRLSFSSFSQKWLCLLSQFES